MSLIKFEISMFTIRKLHSQLKMLNFTMQVVSLVPLPVGLCVICLFIPLYLLDILPGYTVCAVLAAEIIAMSGSFCARYRKANTSLGAQARCGDRVA